MMVQRLAGSFIDVFTAQIRSPEIVDQLCQQRSYAENKATIATDLPRTALVDFSGKTYNDFVAECTTNEIYNGHYLQGNFDGGSVSDLFSPVSMETYHALVSQINKYPAHSPLWNQANDELEIYLAKWKSDKKLRFAYRDDDGQLCSVGFIFSNTDPKNWILEICKNTTAPDLASKDTVLFVNGELARAENSNKTIDLTELSNEIRVELNSKVVTKLISGLIDKNGYVAIATFEDLNRRIVNARNLDNRDVRKAKLDEIIDAISAQFPSLEIVYNYMNELRACSVNEPDFFQNNQFEATLDDILTFVNFIAKKHPNTKAVDYCYLTIGAIKHELFQEKIVREDKPSLTGVAAILIAAAKELRLRRDVLTDTEKESELVIDSETDSEDTGILESSDDDLDFAVDSFDADKKRTQNTGFAASQHGHGFFDATKTVVKNTQTTDMKPDAKGVLTTPVRKG